jgi:transcriptional regulator of acetoin/glycerol metabolism
MAVREFERQYLIRLLAQSRGNITEAARIAGLRRTSVYKLLRRHGLVPKGFR